jgi:hypothetical protein
MKIFVIKDNKIIRQENEGYQPKEGETILIVKESEWPILKRTGGKFFKIHKDDKKEGDIPQGTVTKFKVLRDGEETIISRDKKLETDKLLDFVQPPDMTRVYRGGTSVLTTVDKFDHKTEAIEKSYTKHELRVENKKPRLRTDPEILEDEKEKAIRMKANELSTDPIKMVDGTAKTEIETFAVSINSAKTPAELKSIIEKG